LTGIDLKSLKKLYYSISELAEMFNINSSLIRYWEKEFDFQASKKTTRGNRLYTVKDIEKFNKIYHLVKVEGFTLDGAKNALSNKSKNIQASDKSITDKEDIIQKLENIKSKILSLKR
jgi:DNA-binding transcriptional MerR regulator